jgi:hypothetical protein
MGVKKYRSVEEMPAQTWGRRLDPENIRQACDLTVWTQRLCPPRLVPGLRKYLGVDEAGRRAIDTGRHRGDKDEPVP